MPMGSPPGGPFPDDLKAGTESSSGIRPSRWNACTTHPRAERKAATVVGERSTFLLVGFMSLLGWL